MSANPIPVRSAATNEALVGLLMAKDFLAILDPHETNFTFQTFDDFEYPDGKKRKNKVLVASFYGTLREVASELWKKQKEGAGIFVAVNHFGGKSHTKPDLKRLRAVYCDWDIPGDDPPDWGLQPTMIVETSPGKYHFYWVIDRSRDMTLDEYAKIMQVLVNLGGDPNAKDVSRVLRVPGFKHQKDPSKTRRVELKQHVNGTCRSYTADELCHAFIPLDTEPTPPRKPPAGAVTSLPHLGAVPDYLKAVPSIPGLEVKEFPPTTESDIVAALKFIPSDERFIWLETGMALHSWNPVDGLRLWDEWSKTCKEKFNPVDQAKTWAGFKPGGRVTIATLFHHAKEHGYGSATPRAVSTGTLLDVLYTSDAPTQVSASVKTHETGLIKNSRGGVQSTVENFQAVLNSHSIIIRYNLMKKDLDINIPGIATMRDNRTNVLLSYLTSKCAALSMPLGQIVDYAGVVADDNPFNPAADWIRSRPWDGVDRFTQLTATLHTSASDALKCLYLRKWMTGAVAAAFEPDGVSMQGILVLQGKQGAGKTQWLKALLGTEADLFKDGESLRLDDKDSVFRCVTHWIVELGELEATFKKTDIAQFKAFVGLQTDVLRRPYAKVESTFDRRTVFAASVNSAEFLHDETGNRRFWVLGDARPDWRHGIDMQQVWAQVYELFYIKGDSTGWHMDAEQTEMIEAENVEFNANPAESDPWFDLVTNALDAKPPAELTNGVSISDLLTVVVCMPIEKQTVREQKRMARILRAAGWKDRVVGKARLRRWFKSEPSGAG